MLNIMEIEKEHIEKAVNVGSEKAAEALYHMTGVKVKVSATEIKTVSLSELSSTLSISKDYLVARSQIDKDLEGVSLLAISEKNTLILADLLSGRTLGTSRIIKDIDRSALKETLNIISNAYIVSLGEVLDVFNINILPPSLTEAEYILKDLQDTFTKDGNAVILKTVLNLYDTDLEADLYFIFYNGKES